jgi:hypothetical protein
MDDERSLDGNTAAGMLGEIFPFEMSAVRALCAGCGSMDQIGAHPAYMDAPGMVLRCVHCESVLIRLVHGPGRYWLDMRGAICLQIEESP